MWTKTLYVLISLEYMPKDRIAESYGKFMLKILRISQTVF